MIRKAVDRPPRQALHGQVRNIVLVYLSNNKFGTNKAIHLATGIPECTINDHLRKLWGEKIVYIADYDRTHGMPRKVYKLGKGNDAVLTPLKKPKVKNPTATDINAPFVPRRDVAASWI